MAYDESWQVIYTDILERIQAHYGTFSKGQKAIARFITEHFDKAAYITARVLGQTVDVSESTVVRFAVELGFDGYPQMQRALQELVRFRLTSVQRMEVANARIGETDILRKVLQADNEKIRITLERIDLQSFESIVSVILSARRIHIVGLRSSAALADFLGYYFNLMFDHVRVAQPSLVGEVFEQMLHIKEGDVCIGISFPRYSQGTLQAMRYARDCGAETIAITDSVDSPLARICTYRLLAASDMASFVDSLVAPLSLINALIVAIGMRRKEELRRNFDRLEKLWENEHIYEQVE